MYFAHTPTISGQFWEYFWKDQSPNFLTLQKGPLILTKKGQQTM